MLQETNPTWLNEALSIDGGLLELDHLSDLERRMEPYFQKLPAQNLQYVNAIERCQETYQKVGYKDKVKIVLAHRVMSYVIFLIEEMRKLGTFPTMQMNIKEFRERIASYQNATLQYCADGAQTLSHPEIKRLAASRIPLLNGAFDLVGEMIARGISHNYVLLFAQTLYAARAKDQIFTFTPETQRVVLSLKPNEKVEEEIFDLCTGILQKY